MAEPSEVEVVTLEEVTQKKKKSKLRLIVLALLLLGLGGGSAFFFFNQGTAAKGTKKKAAKKVAGTAEGEESGEEAPAPSVSAVVPLEPFIANLADREEPRYIRITLSLGIEGENKDEGKEIAKDVVTISKLRDAILAVLISKTSGDLLSEKGKKELRRQLLEAVRSKIKKPNVAEVYVTDLVIQM